MSKQIRKNTEKEGKKEDIPEYLRYPADEDIYNKDRKVADTDGDGNLEDLKEKEPMDTYGNDLDVPGAELDDNDEAIGEEDEENNYYSLGGDEHNDLDEDNGE
jgi:hypothetical protein